jgi:hypothetical protein
MPSRKKGEMILFSSEDPSALVNWLVETHGLQNILRLLSEQQPGGTRTASKASSKKGASKKGAKRGRPKGSKNAKKGGRKAKGTDMGNG